MKIGPGLYVPALAELLLIVLFVADVLGDVAWPDGAVVPLRIVLVVAAVAVAAVCYQAWSTVERTQLVHVAALGSLVGGAAVAAAVTTADAGDLFGSRPLATLGVAAVVGAVISHQVASVDRSAPR